MAFQFNQTYTASPFGKIALGGLSSMPAWARGILFLLTIPGILLLALSILLVGVSILALLLPTVPVYLFFKKILGTGGETRSRAADYGSPGSKRVEAVVRDA